MAYTQAQHDALEGAIAIGALKVKYDDGKEVEFRSLREMNIILSQMKKSLGLIDTGPVRHYPHHDKGLGL